MTFRDLHATGNPFILANAWDAGSAKMLAAMGAAAIGTSSAAHAFTLGLPDGGYVTRDQALAHASDLVAAVSVPISGDFENGFGHTPEDVAETVRLSGEAGLAGISVEDAALPDNRAYPFDEAVERIRAGAAAARALPGDFVFVARADGVMNGHYDMDEALRRIKAFDAAGADCLYVPMPPTIEDVARVIAATDKPVNVLVAGPYAKLPKSQFADMGAARLSLGSALARATHRVIRDAGQAMLESGDFTGLTKSISGDVVDAMLTEDKI
jgi:2-methylisocitrate lyase-like PEP mutase family enzyme